MSDKPDEKPAEKPAGESAELPPTATELARELERVKKHVGLDEAPKPPAVVAPLEEDARDWLDRGLEL